MRLLLNQKSVSETPTLLAELRNLIEQDTQFLTASYPLFNEWLSKKVLPGVCAGERTVVIEYRDSSPVGLLIVKHTTEERKLCTLRVRPHFESKGLGVKLFETAFDLLGTDRPLLSVSETTLPKFSKLFDYFGFSHEASYKGVYLPQVLEFAFNGLLEDSSRPQGNWDIPRLTTSIRQRQQERSSTLPSLTHQKRHEGILDSIS